MKTKAILIVILTVILSLAGSDSLYAIKKKDRCDFIVRTLSAPSSTEAGSKIKITSRIKNKGKSKAKKSYTKFYLSKNKTIGKSDYYLGKVKFSALKKNKTSKKKSKYVRIPSWVPSGKYYLIAKADGYKKVKERSEKNNYKKRIIKIRQTNPNLGEHAAGGTYTYNSGDGTLNLNITSSDFEKCGPEVGGDEFIVSSVTSTTMIWDDPEDDDSMSWSRESGSEGDITGTWTMSESSNLYTLTISTDGSLVILGDIGNCAPPTPPIPTATINIDGNFNDWQENGRMYQDEDGPDCDSSGQDIQKVYLAQDSHFIYLRFVLSGTPDETFGYKFGVNDRHIYVGHDSSGGYIFYANGSGLPQPVLPNNFVHVSGNQFEAKFYKADVKAFWENKDLGAWSDQGKETVCRDYVLLEDIVFDW